MATLPPPPPPESEDLYADRLRDLPMEKQFSLRCFFGQIDRTQDIKELRGLLKDMLILNANQEATFRKLMKGDVKGNEKKPQLPDLGG